MHVFLVHVLQFEAGGGVGAGHGVPRIVRVGQHGSKLKALIFLVSSGKRERVGNKIRDFYFFRILFLREMGARRKIKKNAERKIWKHTAHLELREEEEEEKSRSNSNRDEFKDGVLNEERS